METILIIGHGNDSFAFRELRERHPNAHIITPEEVKERGIEFERDEVIKFDEPLRFELRTSNIKESYFHSTPAKNLDSQVWKRRNKNNKR